MPACHLSFWLPILLQSPSLLPISHSQTTVPFSFALFLKEVHRMAQFHICLSHCLSFSAPSHPAVSKTNPVRFPLGQNSEFWNWSWDPIWNFFLVVDSLGTAVATPVLLVFLLLCCWLPSSLNLDPLHLRVTHSSLSWELVPRGEIVVSQECTQWQL